MSESAATAQQTIPLVNEEAVEAPSCGAGSRALREQAAEQANQETLAQYAKDYPVGPHDQPQSMCPAFGSLRVGLRMRRTATVLSGSACCVYGLTFTSHFYGARRTVGYVPFDSETLVTGKLFEDIRESVHQLADPEKYDAVVVINLCVPTASGVPLDLLPDAINGVRVIGIDVPGFGVPTHAEAKDVLAAAMLRYARGEIAAGPVARPAGIEKHQDRPTVALVGEIFPVDAIVVDRLLAPLGAAAGPVIPTREWRELYAALDSQLVAMLHPFYTACQREFEAVGKPIIGSAPVGAEGTASWIEAIGDALGTPRSTVEKHRDELRASISAALAANPINARITMSGYEGSELLVGRMLVSEVTRPVNLTDEQRQAAINDYLRQNNITSPDSLDSLIETSGLTEDAFYDQLLRPTRLARLAQEEFGTKAEARFLSEKGRLDRVVYSLLRLESRSQALEFYLRIANQEANFSDLAGRYSQGSERNTNGIVGPSPLNQSHPVLSEKLRAAKPGQLLEPFRIDRWWIVTRLERFSPATFDEEMSDQMSMELLQEWLQQETSRKLGAFDLNDNGTAQP